MAEMIGANVRIEKWPWNQVALDVERIRKVAHEFKPKLITLVHCETPSGTLNIKIKEIGAIAREVDALFYVDFVSSGGGTLVDVDVRNIDFVYLIVQLIELNLLVIELEYRFGFAWHTKMLKSSTGFRHSNSVSTCMGSCSASQVCTFTLHK